MTRSRTFFEGVARVASVGASLSLVDCGGHAPDNLVAQLQSGAVLCIRPSAEGKRCNTIARYSFATDGSVRARTEVTMSKQVVMATVIPATVRDKAVCQVVRAPDIESATFMISGRPASSQETMELRSRVRANIASRPPQEACMTLALRDGRLIVDVKINGTTRSDLSEPVIWIRADDGYTAGPF